MTNIRELYLRLCMSGVFRKVTEKQLFKCFFDYAKSTATDDKIKAYAAFVSEIYASGTTLTSLVFKLVCEDENTYIKSRARGTNIRVELTYAVKSELLAFESFASLTPEQFDDLSKKIATIRTYQERFEIWVWYFFGISDV